MKKLFYFLMALLLSQHGLAQTCPTFTFNGTAPVAPTATSAGVGGTGSIQTYTVPAGVTSIRIDAKGAKGGSTTFAGGSFSGGKGGRVQGTFVVTPGDVLHILVAGKGGDADGTNVETGTQKRTAAGGGGATIVSNGPIGSGTLLLVAGGGGGAGRQGGGSGSNVFQLGGSGAGGGSNVGAGGASVTANGANTITGDLVERDCGEGGKAAGNGGAAACANRPATNGGGYGGGGAGNYSTPNNGAGGGGGAGYTGGGGAGLAGGNPGTSYIDPGATNTQPLGDNTDDNGSVVINIAATISYTGSPFCKSLTTTGTPITTGFTGGTFSATPTGLTIDANTGVINPSTSTAGTYTVSYSLPSGCTPVTTTVTINPLPTVSGPANLLDNSTSGLCGKVITYNTSSSGTPAPTITYTLTGATTGSGSGNGSGTFFKVGTTTVKLTATNSCGEVTYSFDITISGSTTITLGTVPTICSGAMSFAIPFTSTTGTPTTYSISGTGFTTLTDAVLPSSPITVNLTTPPASGTSIPFTLTVKNAAGCTSADMTGNVIVNALPTILAGTVTHPSTCGGADGSIPFTTTNLPNGTYSLSFIGSVGATASPQNVVVLGNVFTLTGLKAGTYSGFSVTNTGCTGSDATTKVLNDPTKPTVSLTALSQTLLEGTSLTLCDTDPNPVNELQFNITTTCLSGSPVWRVQIGGGNWSVWSSTAPSSQNSDNQTYRYQAACDANCTNTYTQVIALAINYRVSLPQNVSMIADGTTIVEGEEKSICDQSGNGLTFNATCATGERLLYSVDGGVYLPTAPAQIVDGNFHNYRVRCQKSDGTISCVETESGVMRLKISTIAAAPVASLNVTSGCGTPSSFSGTANCGSLTTVWYNATTNVALPNFPNTTPNETTSYYARCQGDVGCQSGVSNTVTFTVVPVNNAPVITVSSDLVCTGVSVTVSANCPAGSTAFWNTGVTTNSFQVAFNNVTTQGYSAKCIFENGCQSSVSDFKTVRWKAFELTIINIGQSKSAIKTNDRAAWASQFVTADGGPNLDNSTEINPTLYFTENANKTGPRYWTIHADACALGTNGSLTFDMLLRPETGVAQSFNTHENNAPYFMYANRDGYTELYAQNHPAYGFYLDNGAGGNVYDAGLPKGLYKLGIRYWDQKGQGSIYPSTRQPAGNVLAYQEFWFRIQSKDGVGVGAARVTATDLSSRRDLNPLTFAEVMPNPVSNVLRLKVTEAKAQKVNISLIDASGRTLLQRGFVPETNQHQEEFEVSELANGMYFLKVNTGEKQATLKVVKVQ